MKRQVVIWLFIGVMLCAFSAQAYAADIIWNVAGSAVMINGTAATVNGAFNLQVAPIGVSPIGRVDFYTDGAYTHTENIAPYWYFGDNSPAPKLGTVSTTKHIVEARVYSGGYMVYKETFQLLPSSASTSSTPPPSTSNLLKNPDFISSLIYWEYHPGGYVTWSSYGKNEIGSMRMTPNWGGVSEAYPQNQRVSVHPGDKITYEGWFKAGPRGSNNCDIGTGLGWDLRQSGSDSIIFAMNGPATTNTYWTYIKSDYIIPCKGKLTGPITGWSVSSGTSGTCNGGAKAGLYSNYYYLNGNNMPYSLTVVPWVHIWHTDTVQSANIDNLKFSITPGALKC